MKTILEELSERFSKAAGEPVEVAKSREGFGDYQCNSAMKLAKARKANPRHIAQEIIDNFDGQELVEKVEIAGPGFINVYLSKEAITERVDQIAHDERLGVPQVTPQRVIVEFSSPNTAKEMHVGHLRSTVIGDSIARILEFLGHDVLRLSHVGDWGTNFGMLIAYMRGGPQEGTLSDLVTWYKAAKKRFDADPEFKKQAQLEVVELQSGNAESLAIWNKLCEISRRAYNQIYDLLDVHVEERGESFYNPILPQTVEALQPLITISNDAKCIFLDGYTNREGEPLPMIVQKADGGYLYATTDMAALRQRIDEEKADWIVYVVDLGQALHFKMVFDAAEKAGFVDRSKTRLDHAAFGLVLGSDGKKFRTRSGETEKLIDLLEAAIAHAKNILQARLSDDPDLDNLARALGIGAVKYADLSCNRGSDYVFAYDKMLSLEGNTAAFLLYSYVRIQSIERKVGKPTPGAKIDLQHPSEIALGLHLARFGEAVNAAARDLLPNRIADYLYELAGRFNAFFRDCHVQGTPEQDQRLLLCQTTARTMAKGLNLLGIRTIDRM